MLNRKRRLTLSNDDSGSIRRREFKFNDNLAYVMMSNHDYIGESMKKSVHIHSIIE